MKKAEIKNAEKKKLVGTLDNYDIRILRELDCNARATLKSIGKTIKRPKEFVRYRFNKLVETGIIDTFITSIDYAKLGMYRVCLYAKFDEMHTELKQKVMKYRKMHECRMKFFSVGIYDVYIDWIIQENTNADAHIHEFMKEFGEHIHEVSINLLHRVKYYQNRYLYGKLVAEPFVSDYTTREKGEITKDDMKLLTALREYPRIKIIDLAEKCGITPKTALSKMRTLKRKKIITGFCVKLNNPLVDKEDFIVLLQLHNKNDASKLKIESYLDTVNEVSYMGWLMGTFDIEFAITVESQEEFIRIFETMRSTLKDDIRNSQVLFLTP